MNLRPPSAALSLLVLIACGPESAPEATESATTSGASDSVGTSTGPGTATGPNPTTVMPTTEPTTDPTTPTGPAGIDVSGEYLMAVSTIIDPTHPIYSLVSIVGAYGPDGGEFDMTMQPLAVEIGAQVPTPEAVGDPTALFGVPVNAVGEFSIPLTGLAIPGPANPITGSDILVDLELAGVFQHPLVEGYCGDVRGTLLDPLQADLAGSTFAAIRVPGINGLPADPTPYTCR